MNLVARLTVKGPLLEGKAPEIIRRNQELAITEIVMFLLPKIKAATPQGVYGAQGGLLGSIQADFQGKGTPVFKGVIATAHKYGAVIEKGRAAGKGMPPKGSLVRWLEVKFGLDTVAAQRIEFVVRRKIGQKGFEGKHMFSKGLKENWGALKGISGHYGFQMVRELNGG